MKKLFRLTTTAALLCCFQVACATSAPPRTPSSPSSPQPPVAAEAGDIEAEKAVIEPLARLESNPIAKAPITKRSSTTTAPTNLLPPVTQRQNTSNVDMCAGSLSDASEVVIPAVAKPPFMKYYKDPAFGSKVIRVTNGAFGEVRKPPYSTMQAWNADESLILLYKAGPDATHMLIDGHSYKPVKRITIHPTDLEEVFWSHTDPDVLYYMSQYPSDYGQLKKYNVRNDSSVAVADLGQYCGKNGLPVAGGDVHMQSLDDDLFGFRCKVSSDSYLMMSYRVSTNTVITEPIGEGHKYNEWTAPMPGPSGKRFWMQGDALGTDLVKVERTMDLYKNNEHSNVGQTYDGKDALYQTGFDPSPKGCHGDRDRGVGHLIQHNLETGECKPFINESEGYPYTTSSTHISAQAYLRPGWIAMSSIGRANQFKYFKNKRPAPPLLSEIYLADTNPNHRVTCRLAHHRSYGKDAQNGDYPAYFGEPHATISPSGTRIIFASDWYDSGTVDSYVIELPGYQKPAK